MIALRILEYISRAGKYRGTLKKRDMDKVVFEGGTEVAVDSPNSIIIRNARIEAHIIIREMNDEELREIARKIYSLIRSVGGLKRRIRSFFM